MLQFQDCWVKVNVGQHHKSEDVHSTLKKATSPAEKACSHYWRVTSATTKRQRSSVLYWTSVLTMKWLLVVVRPSPDLTKSRSPRCSWPSPRLIHTRHVSWTCHNIVVSSCAVLSSIPYGSVTGPSQMFHCYQTHLPRQHLWVWVWDYRDPTTTMCNSPGPVSALFVHYHHLSSTSFMSQAVGGAQMPQKHTGQPNSACPSHLKVSRFVD